MRAALVSCFVSFGFLGFAGSAAAAESDAGGYCSVTASVANFPELAGLPERPRRMICAEVAALDQMLVYNRFGSHDPFGMMFALVRDLVPAATPVPPDLDCDEDPGLGATPAALEPGAVRLRDCKRPRPLTLRANVGDVVHVRVHNLLREARPGYSETFCRQAGVVEGTFAEHVRAEVSEGGAAGEEGHYRAVGDRLVAAMCAAGSASKTPEPARDDFNWPSTRGINFVIDGLRPLADPATHEVDPVCLGLAQLEPGTGTVDCYWHAEREGPHFVNSIAAASGGEGDGGTLVHGLFGSLAVEPQEAAEAATEWYRSQVSPRAFDDAWKPAGTDVPHARKDTLDYARLNLLEKVGDGRFELVHNDLNAIIAPAGKVAFREFTVMFHDELKTFYTSNFEELDRFPQFAGIRDGFGINYGSSGLGALVLANRKGIGPAAGCAECLYEEFFLESWANGDPALLERFTDDPSNVHHSYLGDPVVFRNYHAGPKETHVFHLHAHQWLGGNDVGRGAYLDSQTVAPRQGFTYNIYGGGRTKAKGADEDRWAVAGSGNRNLTVGDSIFHCHLYPHFAQGMWELWRVHDVLEDGTRKLPDGQAQPGLSTEIVGTDGARQGSVADDGSFVPYAAGTPIPGLVPLPGVAAPLLPTYAAAGDTGKPVPGYPFFVAGKPGHRTPQAPLDIAVENGKPLDGGLPRHVVMDGSHVALGVGEPAGTGADDLYRLTAKMLALGDFSGHLTKANIDVLPADGTDREKAAMAFHDDGAGLKLRDARGGTATYDAAAGGYLSLAAGDASARRFAVNGGRPKPGAPFADPCAAPGYDAANGVVDPLDGKPFRADPKLTGFRRYAASAVQVDLVTNKAGWHDPQGRINVLTSVSDDYKDFGPRTDEEPFFFRAYSGECIEFRHTNELPKELELDDFQVQTPTDTIGQHIHLVKFDVTSADGSGNGWNYEDGTFAADEIATRLCAMLDPTQVTPKVGAGSKLSDTDRARIETATATGSFCVREGEGDGAHWKPSRTDWWSAKRGEHPERFQTTVQRWFADPILSVDNDISATGVDRQNRTLRTVFTHDHFGPSSIQQHGFYSALVIEPDGKQVCPGTIVAGAEPECLDPPATRMTLADDGARGVGTHKVVRTPPGPSGAPGPSDAIHPDYREFALAIADFALLYDPTDGSKADMRAAAGALPGGGALADPGPGGIDPRDVTFGQPKGLATLVCEADHRRVGDDPAAIEKACGSAVPTEAIGATTRVVEAAGIPPAVVASALIDAGDVQALRQKFVLVRTRAGNGAGFARPVNAPDRPEVISADHHDPYLVNYNGEPVPLRIGDTGSRTAFDCYAEAGSGEAVAVPGAPFPDDATIAALAQMPVPDCSIVSQSADPRGNVANVFRSRFYPNETQPASAPPAEPPARTADAAAVAGNLVRNRDHGDPATPLLETYSGERVQFRLIQGAQEVQHTFNLEGLAWRRQVDQRYPAAGRPLDTDLTGLTWWQTCRERGLHGIAAHHEKWRSGRLPKAVPGNPASDYWTDHTAAVAACDNLEDFVSAQEVGISEHFEIDAVPSKYAYTVRALPDDEKEDVSLDYLYDFGSQDAIWNGAWGLMRVYENAGVKLDPDTDETAGDHLAPVSDHGTTGFRGDKDTVKTSLQCPRGAPEVTAWAVAMPLPSGQKYGSWGSAVRDPDALALVHVPNALADSWRARGWLRETEADGKQRYDVAPARIADLRNEARGYFRDEPMVVRANAGDCLNLAIVNALTPALSGPACGSGNGIPGPMRDCLGDTRLPRIVRLNVEPTWEARAEEANGPVRHEQLDRIDVRPSAQIAFTTALSMLTPGGEASLPFGDNLTAAVPPGGVQSAVYYLGLLNIDWVGLDRALGDHSLIRACGAETGPADAATQRAREIMRGGTDNAAGARLDLLFEENPRPDDQRGANEKWFTIDILGATYSFRIGNGQDETVATRDAAKAALAACLADRLDPATEADRPPDERIVSAIPYAFGAVPLKPMADLFGQLPHGLFGSIVVEPKGATYLGRDEQRHRLDPAAGPFLAAAGHRGRGQNTLVRLADGQVLREFVLFYQDGLNLWDAESGNEWFPEDGGGPYPIVDDCRVCDDSYDLGEKAVSYRAPAFSRRLRDTLGTDVESHDNLNRFDFPGDFRLIKDSTTSNPLRLWAQEGEQVMIRVVHPGGRARQRAFVTAGNDYDDQFPGFGFPHSALLAPGKTVTAAFSAPVRSGCYLWSDGPRFIEAEGAWGLVDVLTADGASACGFHP